MGQRDCSYCLDHAPSVNRLCGEVQQEASPIWASFSKPIQIDSLRRGSISDATGGLHSSQPGQGRNGGGHFGVAGIPFCRAQCLDGEDVSSLAGYGTGSEVARWLQVDRSAVSRAVRRVEIDPDLPETARLVSGVFGLPEPDKSQHTVPLPTDGF